MKPQTMLHIKRILPMRSAELLRPLYHTLINLSRIPAKRKTKHIFTEATDSPSYLDIDELEGLQLEYPCQPVYVDDTHANKIRGIERARQILRLPGAREADSFLELGCWDGMVSYSLCRKGKKATAIDNRAEGFDERASLEGVNLIEMDAGNMQFNDESFDYVFSFNSFEHFSSPEDVFREAIRVVKTGGYIYLEFAPLYYAPFGEHAWCSVSVPYCQFLWTRDLLNEYCEQKGLELIDFSHVNGWPLERYESLWGKYSNNLQRIRYKRSFDLSHLSMIRRFPSCFKSKSDSFENFIVSGISVLFKKELPDRKTD